MIRQPNSCGRIVHRYDGHRNRSSRNAAFAVDDGVEDCVSAIEIRVRRILQCAVGQDDDGSVTRTCLRDRQGVAVGVNVIRKHSNLDRRVFVCRGHVVDRTWCRVGNGPAKALRGSAAATITCSDRYGIDPAIYLACTVVDNAADNPRRRVNCEACGKTRSGIGQEVAVGIAKRAGNRQANRLAVEIGLVADRARCERRIIHIGNGNGDRRSRRATIAVADRVSDRVCAVEAWIGRVRHGAIRVDGDYAVLCSGGRHGKRVAIGVGVVGQRADRHRGVFCGRSAVIGRSWRGVADVECDRLRYGPAISVGHSYRRCIDATVGLAGISSDRSTD